MLNESVLFRNNGHNLSSTLWESGREGKRVSNKFINVFSMGNLRDMPLHIHNIKHSSNEHTTIKHKR